MQERFGESSGVAMVRAPSGTVGHVFISMLHLSSTWRIYYLYSRHYSRDLPQGGLELPCILKFEGSPD